MLRRLTNGEFALAVLVASLFWIAVLVWATSSAPTNPQKAACYQAANNSSRSTEECKSFWEKTTSDPIAMFTLVLAFSTVGLWAATIGLYRAGERQLSHLKESAEQQLGAYVGVSERQIISHDGGNTFVVEISIKNSGQTPAYRVTHCIDADVRDRLSREAEAYPPPPRLPQEWVMAPGATWKLVKDIAIGGPSGAGSIARQRDIFTWGRVDYFDVFDKPQYLLFRFRSSDRLIRVHNNTVMMTVGWELDPCQEGNTST